LGALKRGRENLRTGTASPSTDNTVSGRGPIDVVRACTSSPGPINTGSTRSNRARESTREPSATWGRSNAAATIRTLARRRPARIIPSVGAGAVQSMAPVHLVKITRDRLDAETRRGPDCSQFHGSAGSANLVPWSTVCVSKFENAAHVRILEHYSLQRCRNPSQVLPR
jgi:hypothetical protein